LRVWTRWWEESDGRGAKVTDLFGSGEGVRGVEDESELREPTEVLELNDAKFLDIE
jgi:hypothetical protein